MGDLFPGVNRMGDRSAEGQRTLTPLTQVRILVPQPETNEGLTHLGSGPFCLRFCTSPGVVPVSLEKLIISDSRNGSMDW